MSKFRIMRDGEVQHEFECAPADMEIMALRWMHVHCAAASAYYYLRYEGYSIVDEEGKRVDWVGRKGDPK